MTTPYFQLTSAALAQGADAAAHGLQMTISSFKIGSAFGYTPATDGSETALHGGILYAGSIDTYTEQSDGSLCMVCTLPAIAGPFEFGEIGIYLSNGTLLASAAFPELITKFSSLASNVATSFSFNCYIQLDVGVGNFTIFADGSSISIGTIVAPVPPALPFVGTLWYDIGLTGRGYVWTSSGWVDFCPGAVGPRGVDGISGYSGYSGAPGISVGAAPTTTPGIGQFVFINNGVIPAGGTWAYYNIITADDGNVTGVGGMGGIVAGGTTISPGGTGGWGGGAGGNYGWAWRIA